MNIANFITVSRIAASIGLLFPTPFTAVFFVLYTYAGISDILDGWAARHFHTAGKLGAALDSISDAVFICVVLIKIIPLVLDRSSVPLLPVLLVIAAVKICAYVTGGIKFHEFTALHTYLNKAAGFLLFLLPYLFTSDIFSPMVAALCILAGTAAVEELVIMIRSRRFLPDIRGMFDQRAFESTEKKEQTDDGN